MDVWRWICGIITVELTSAEPEIALSNLTGMGIELYQLEKKRDLTYSFQILRREWDLVQEFCEKHGASPRIICCNGLYYVAESVLQRKLLLSGLIFLLFITIFLPGRILFVSVEGNHTVPSKQILAAAEEAGIGFGASRRKIRSEKVKNRLLSAIPQLQWAGVNTSGCVAFISVREQGAQDTESELPEVSNIIAIRDGYILSATATEGNLMVQPGQTVREGQVLISGYTDCGICIQATRSSGEVYAQTHHKSVAVTPLKWVYRMDAGDSNKKISLLWRKKRINLWKGSGKVSPICGRMYEEYYVTLPGGFSLPLGLCVETFVDHSIAAAEMDVKYAEWALSGFMEEYLMMHMAAGRILERNEVCSREDDLLYLTGEYVCSEMIGRVQHE